jgi:hypothetical protein
MSRYRTLLAAFAIAASAAVASSASASPATERVADHWTPERIAQAQPRDIVMDARGLSYLRLKGGVLKPYGHSTPARVRAARANGPLSTAAPVPRADTLAPSISSWDPAGGTIGADRVFRATVTDDESGLRSVSFVLTYPDGRRQSFAAARTSGNDWTVSFTGFWNGNWKWEIVAKDNGAKGGNTARVGPIPFTVNTGGGSGGGDPSIEANAPWTQPSTVKTAAGRIYFEMPANRRLTKWNGYVCSGTVVNDDRGGDAIVLTAAHCVYDDVNKVFARNVMFIPDQAANNTSTDRDCSNDFHGCWVADFGVVDSDWTSRTWPDNIRWDYAYYVIPPSGYRNGTPTGPIPDPKSLDDLGAKLDISFAAPSPGDLLTHAFGYSYSEDPKFMYCSQGLGTEGTFTWWLSECGLSGGASGGPWVAPLSGGTGPIISVNSYGYSTGPGMGGPMLADSSDSSASCLLDAANDDSLSVILRGVVPAC